MCKYPLNPKAIYQTGTMYQEFRGVPGQTKVTKNDLYYSLVFFCYSLDKLFHYSSKLKANHLYHCQKIFIPVEFEDINNLMTCPSYAQ